ncbi:MAG: T9SS type A sorting domain-containing protein [Candidatus Eisenbacteria bacterium]
MFSIVPDGSGGWYLAGAFETVGNMPRARLAHVDADGVVTNWSPEANGLVRGMALAGDTLYLCGGFNAINGTPRKYLAAVDKVTGELLNWNPSAAGTSSATVGSILVDGNTVYVGGSFTWVGGVPRNYLAAIDATTGAVTPWDPSPNRYATPFAVVGSTVYVYGSFESIGGSPRNGVAALDTVTGTATAWDPNVDGDVDAMASTGDTFVLAGDFDSVGGEPRASVAEVDIATGLPTAWNPGVTGGEQTVSAVVVDAPVVYLGGDFAEVGGQSRRNLASVDLTTGVPLDWELPCFGVDNLSLGDGVLFVGGTGFNAVTRNNVAAIDLNTGRPTSWNPDVDFGSYPYGVSAISVTGSTVYIGGGFATVGGEARSRIAATDAVDGSVRPWNPGANKQVSVIWSDSSSVLVGGEFTTIAGEPKGFLAALDPETGTVMDWNPDPNWYVKCLSVSGDTVFLGGGFTTVGGEPRSRIAAVDRSTGEVASWAADANWDVHSIADDGGRLLLGGNFTTVAGESRLRLAAVDKETGLVGPWNPSASDVVNALGLDGSTVVVGGSFLSIDGEARNGIAAVDGESGEVLAWDPHPVFSEFTAPDIFAVLPIGAEYLVSGPFQGIADQLWWRTSASLSGPNSTVDIGPSDELFGRTWTRLSATPNPSHGRTQVSFELPKPGQAKLTLFDVSGRFVDVLADGEFSEGRHSLSVDAGRLAAGAYILQLRTGDVLEAHKLLVVR